MDQRAIISITQLVNAIYTSDQYADNGKREKAHKNLELGWHLRLDSFGLLESNGVFSRKEDENNKSENLKR